jgi:alcohol dehydrogenase
LTPGAIFRQSGDDAKVGLMSNSLRPTAAFIDPDLTLSCPRGLTIDSALDALTHAVESYIALPTEGYPNVAVAAVYSGANLVTKTFAQKAISLVFEHLPVVAREPNSRDSRSGMALASLFAAMSYSTAGLHGVHAMSYAIASLSHKPHGQTLAIVLPESLWELRHVCEEELAELGRMLGGCHESKAADAEYFIDRLRTLLRELDVSTNLSDWGIREGQIDRLVEDSVAIHRLSKAFPIQPPKEAYRRIFKSAL